MDIVDMKLLKQMSVNIGEVARITGLDVRKIRYWESKGIIVSTEIEANKTRKFDYYEIKKIILIKELIDEGCTLDAAFNKVKERIKKLNDAFNELENSTKNKNRNDNE